MFFTFWTALLHDIKDYFTDRFFKTSIVVHLFYTAMEVYIIIKLGGLYSYPVYSANSGG